MEALLKRGVKATRDGERIAMTLPVERIDIDRILSARTLDDIKPEITCFTSATISFAPSAVLKNIVFQVEYDPTWGADCCPCTGDVTDAILDCGYDSGSDRELANKYYTGEIDINAIFAKIEELQIDKEQAIMDRRYYDAKAILDKEQPLKQRIEDLLRDSIRDS